MLDETRESKMNGSDRLENENDSRTTHSFLGRLVGWTWRWGRWGSGVGVGKTFHGVFTFFVSGFRFG